MYVGVELTLMLIVRKETEENVKPWLLEGISAYKVELNSSKFTEILASCRILERFRRILESFRRILICWFG